LAAGTGGTAMIQRLNTKLFIMKIQFLYGSIFSVLVLVIILNPALAGPNESVGEVTYTNASSNDIKDISEWVRNKFAGKRNIESLDVEAIIYTSPVMAEVFIPGSFYVHITINGDKSPGMVMCRTGSGIEMVPSRRSSSHDLVTPLHLNQRFKITNEENAILFHKALAHFYDRGDPNFSSNREAEKMGDIWTLTDTLENSIETGYKVKINTEGKVLEISNYVIFPEEE
jgi:hypothetical protein